MVRLRSSIVVGLAVLLLVSSCSSDKKATSTGSSGAPSSSAAPAELTDSFRGVTKTSIKIGVAVVDFECIKQFVDSTQGDAQKIVNALVDDINKNGGVLGRKIDVVFKALCPLKQDDVAAACTAFTDDEQVFAVIGVYDTPPGDGSNQLCISRDHETVQINELVTSKAMEQSPPGLLLSPGILPERRLRALLSLVKQEKTLDGKKVALLADQDTVGPAEKALKDFVSGAGLQQGSTATLSISGPDTTQAQSQLDSFIEKWKSEGVNALVMAGLQASAKQFVEKIRAAMPDLLLLADDTSTGEQAQDEVKAGLSPNPYEGMISAAGLSDDETFKLDSVQKCVKAYESATGDKVIAPADLKPGPDGKTVQVYVGIQDRCNELTLLKLVAEKAGANLTNDTWVAAANSIGKIKIPTAQIASLGQGKYDAEDGFRLARFDSTIPPNGDFKPLSPELLDVTK